jgi:glycosyltransferase involved in cell wall biosynthesis
MVKISAVIPVFNSEALVGQTVDRTVACFEKHGLCYEILLINDGSPDKSWEIVRNKARANPHIVAINLLRNYGQHTAMFCGLQHSRGDFVITLDDDLQNPPEEMIHLIDKAKEGHDVVFGRFRQKQHAPYRRLGTRIIGVINERIFHKPPALVLSNFRLIRRDVVNRICGYQTNYPYIQGLVLMFATNPANVLVEHAERPIGKSNYNFIRIARLVMAILFNYSSVPLRIVSTIGIAVSVLSLGLGLLYFLRALVIGTTVPGWTSVVVLLSLLNGISMLMIGMLGEYLVRLLNQLSQTERYHIREIIDSRA